MGGFAFCCGYQPGGVADEAPLIAAMIAIFGIAPDVGLMSKLRRLFFEAHTTALVDMRARIEGATDETPKRIQLPERVARMEQLRARYPGLWIGAELEFSHALLDRVIDQFAKNELRYIPLEECTRRDQELDGIKRDDVLKIEIKRDDTLKLEREPAKPLARLATDLEVKSAFLRRALAYDAGGLLTFGVHEGWIGKLFRIMQEPAVEAHSQVTLMQAYRADRRLWAKMADETLGNIVPQLGGVKPLDLALAKFAIDVEVTFLLLPLPFYTGMPSSHSGPALAEARNNTPSVPSIAAHSGKGKLNNQGAKSGPYSKGGKGTKGGQGKKGAKVDQAIKISPMGCALYFNQKPVCIFYNGPKGCNSKNINPGKRCGRGFHLCGKVLCTGSVCGEEHSLADCPHQ